MDDFFCVKDNTWCIDTGHTLMGVYRLNDKDVIMMDTGTSFGLSYEIPDTVKLMNVLEREGLNVKAITATHGHLDHIGNNDTLIKKYGCKVYMYGAEAYLCRNVEALRFQYSLVPYTGVIEKALNYMVTDVDYFIPPDAHEVVICGKRFGIVHTPGHSMSHISLITEDNVMMVGDTLMTFDEMKKTKIPYSMNFQIDFESKRKLLGVNCDKYIISHKGVREDLKYEVEANIQYLKDRADVVLSYVEDGMCFDDIAAAVINYMNIKIKSNRYTFFDIHAMIMPYVQYLEEVGKLETWYDKGYIRYKAAENE